VWVLEETDFYKEKAMSKEEMKKYETVIPGWNTCKRNLWWKEIEITFEYVVEVKK